MSSPKPPATKHKFQIRNGMTAIQLAKESAASPLQTLYDLVTSKSNTLIRAWPGSEQSVRKESAKRVITMLMQNAQSNPKLLACTLDSLLGAVIQACRLGLYPGDVLALAHLVPFSGMVQFIIGYRGYIELIRRAGQIRNTTPAIVRAADFFVYTDFPRKMRHIRHEMASFDDEASRYVEKRLKVVSDPDEMVAAYCVFDYVMDAHQHFSTPLSKKQIDTIRDGSRGINYRDGSKNMDSPWYTHPDSMWMKTAIRHGVKYISLSTEDKSLELIGQVATDERIVSSFQETDKSVDAVFDDDDAIPTTGERVPEVGDAGQPEPEASPTDSGAPTEPATAMDRFVTGQAASQSVASTEPAGAAPVAAPTPPAAPVIPAESSAPPAPNTTATESKPPTEQPARQRVARRPATNK